MRYLHPKSPRYYPPAGDKTLLDIYKANKVKYGPKRFNLAKYLDLFDTIDLRTGEKVDGEGLLWKTISRMKYDDVFVDDLAELNLDCNIETFTAFLTANKLVCNHCVPKGDNQPYKRPTRRCRNEQCEYLLCEECYLEPVKRTR